MRTTYHLSFLALAASVAAQQPENSSAQNFFDTIQVPIHSSGDDEVGDRYGIWAAGPDYKVRLDGGFEFYPVLGSAYAANLPLSWCTRSVTIGGIELAGEVRREARVDDFRYEYRLGGGVVEAYDIRLDGVEQTFRIASPPAGRGDLVVVGEVTTTLHAEAREPQFGGIEFLGPEGERIVDYGAATAIDAGGRSFPMTTSFDGTRIHLRLDAASVGSARFPLVVDPLIGSDSSRECGMTAVATLDQVLVGQPTGLGVYTRLNSATDHDAFALLTHPGLGLAALAWADIAGHSTEQVGVGAMNQSRRLVIAAERRAGFRTHMELYSHDPSSLTFRSGVSRVLSSLSGEHYRNPDVGGATTGDIAIVVYDYTIPGMGSRRIRALRSNAITGAFSFFSNDIAGESATNHERDPSITPYGPSWIVAWAESETASGAIRGRRVYSNGTLDLSSQILQPAGNRVYHEPRVAGRDGNYVVTWRQTPTFIGTVSVAAGRFDWASGPTIPTLLGARTLHGGGSGYANGEVAFDATTRSHWIATYDRNESLLGRVVGAARIGFSGTVIDTTDVHGSAGDQPFASSIAFSEGLDGDAFDVVYATRNTTDHRVLGEQYLYPAECYVHTPYGTGCGTFDDESYSPTITGSRFFTLALESHFSGVAACFISPLQSSLPLDSINMFGCTFLVEPALSITAPGALINGRFEVTFRLPDTFTGFFNTQWFYTEPGANPLGLVSNAARTHEAR